MNILLIDQDRCGLDFAARCADAGHQVRWYRKTKRPVKDGIGFPGVKIVDGWRDHMKWAKDGLILTTANCSLLKELDAFREFGFPIFAPSFKSAQMEIDRAAGMQLLQQVGANIPPFKTFASLEDAERHARKSDQAFVFKTMGDEEDKSLSYVSKDPADLVGWLRRKIATGMKLKGPCMLQEKIEMIAEVGAAGWMGRDGFLPGKWELSFEHKKLMPGDYGPNTGEQGTVCQYVDSLKPAEEVLKPLEEAFRNLGHTGDLNVNGGVDKKGGYWPFEFTCRAGWPDFYIRTAMHKGDPAQWMRDALLGKDTLKVSRDVAIGVVCSQPQYPYDTATPEMVEGNPISGLEAVWDNVHPVQVMVGAGPVMKAGKVVDAAQFQTTGEYVLVATGLGKTIEAARDEVYGVVKEISLPNMIVRNDIGVKVQEQLPELHKLGYATQMEA